MKRYKLKRWYPSLPNGLKEGDEVWRPQRKDCKEFWGYTTKKLALSGRDIPVEEVENNPEFWEEVENMPLFTTEDGVDIYEGEYYYVPQRKGWSTEEFSGHIAKLDARADKNYKADDSKRFSTKKAAERFLDEQKVLFTTSDGIDIHVGDPYYSVDTIEWYITSLKGYRRSGKLDHKKYFSTREKAEKYLYEHAPKYSRRQIIDAFWKARVGSMASGEVIRIDIFKDELGL